MVQIADIATGNYWKHMGMITGPDVDGEIQVILEVTENLKQFYGNVHGGVIAGLLDSCIAMAVNQQLDSEHGASTVEMNAVPCIIAYIITIKGIIIRII